VQASFARISFATKCLPSIDLCWTTMRTAPEPRHASGCAGTPALATSLHDPAAASAASSFQAEISHCGV
jgi:hypothetical protein